MREVKWEQAHVGVWRVETRDAPNQSSFTDKELANLECPEGKVSSPAWAVSLVAAMGRADWSTVLETAMLEEVLQGRRGRSSKGSPEGAEVNIC